MKKLLGVSSYLAISAGIIMIVVGAWGIYFTCKNVTRENIVTPNDASIPAQEVRGPLTLKAQVDIIRKHALEQTGGKTYAEMPRQIPKIDSNGQQILGADGKPVMVANEARNVWITVTALTTALNLAMLAYAFSALFILFGLISIWTGVIYCKMSRTFAQ